MIDKIKLYTKDFTLNKYNNLIIKYSISNTDNIKIIEKQSYWYNTNNSSINLTIIIKRDYLFIYFSPSKFYSNINYPLISNPDTLHYILREVEKACNNIGLHFELNKLKIGNIEIAKDIEIDYPISCYSHLFRSLSGKQLIKQPHETNWYFGNKSRGFIFYDKTKHLTEKYNYKIANNILRAELRLKKPKIVRRDTSLNTVEDLLSPDILEYCNEIYKNLLHSLIFYNDYTDNQPCETNLQLFQSYISDYRSKGFYKFLFDLGIQKFINEDGVFQALWDIAKQEKILPSTVTYQKQKILKLSKNSRSYNPKSNTSLYRELKKKLLDK